MLLSQVVLLWVSSYFRGKWYLGFNINLLVSIQESMLLAQVVLLCLISIVVTQISGSILLALMLQILHSHLRLILLVELTFLALVFMLLIQVHLVIQLSAILFQTLQMCLALLPVQILCFNMPTCLLTSMHALNQIDSVCSLLSASVPQSLKKKKCRRGLYRFGFALDKVGKVYEPEDMKLTVDEKG